MVKTDTEIMQEIGMLWIKLKMSPSEAREDLIRHEEKTRLRDLSRIALCGTLCRLQYEYDKNMGKFDEVYEAGPTWGEI